MEVILSCIFFIPSAKEVPNEGFSIISLDRLKISLLEKKKAYVDWYYQNGRVEAQKPWDASRFSKDSNLLANVRSRPEARKGKWKELGLTKVVYKIEK